MADNVTVTPSASYTVAAEDIGGGVEMQRVKLVLGSVGADSGDVAATNPIPVTGSVGVSGAVSISAMPAVSGTVTVNGSVAVVPGVSVVAQASGTVTVGTGTVSVSGPVQVSGAVSISAMPAVSISISAALGTVITVLGTQIVSVVPGLSVSAVVSGTVNVSVVNALNTVVTILGTQVVSVVPGLSVSAVVSGTVTVANGPSVTIQQGASVVAQVSGTVTVGGISGTVTPLYSTTAAPGAAATGEIVWVANPGAGVATTELTVKTILGTAVVSVVPGVSVVAQVSGTVTAVAGSTAVATVTQAAVTGAVVWLAPTQTIQATVNTIAAGFSVNALVTGVVSVSVLPAVSISVSAALGTVITILGTQVVSVVPGLSVSAQVSGVVSVSVLPAVSISVSAALGTVITILGTQVVSVVPGLSVSAQVSGAVSISAMPAVSLLTIAGTVNYVTSGLTGLPVWPGTPGYLPVIMMVTSTAGVVSATTYLFTVWTGVVAAAAATTGWVIPAGKTLRVQNIQAVINSSAVTGGTVQVLVANASAVASLTSAALATCGRGIMLQVLVSAGPIAASIIGGQGDIPAGSTIAIFGVGSTAYNIQNVIIQGYLF